MAFIFADGFDHYVPAGHPAASVAAHLAAAGYVLTNPAEGALAIVQGGDEGSLAVRLSAAIGNTAPPTLTRSLSSTANLVVHQFRFLGTGPHSRIARIDDVIDVAWDAVTGRVRVGNELGPNVLVRDGHFSIEIEVDRGAGELRVWANDTAQVVAPLPASDGDYTISWGDPTEATTAARSVLIDDYTVIDSSPGEHVTRFGPMAVILRSPATDVGPNQFSLVGSASATRWNVMAQLDALRANAPYLQSNTEGHTEMFGSNVVLPNDNAIVAVTQVVYARKGDLDDRAVGLRLASPDGEIEVQRSLSESGRFHQASYELAPGSLAWTRARVESVQFGFVAR